MLLSGALSLLCGRRSAGAPIKASLFAQRSWIDQFHLHPRQGVIPCVISLRHIFALLVILNRFSRLTRRGAKKKVQRGEKKKKKKKDRWRGSQRWKGETDRDRCRERKREAGVGEMRERAVKWKGPSGGPLQLCGCGCLSRLSSPRMRMGHSRWDVLLALAGSLGLFWLRAALLLYKRRALANVSEATLLIAQNNPWLLGLLTHPRLALVHLAKRKPPPLTIPASVDGKSDSRNTFSWLKVSA